MASITDFKDNRFPYRSIPILKIREAAQTVNIPEKTRINQLKMICQSGMIVNPQRSVIMRNEVVGQKLKNTKSGLLGSARTNAERKRGNVNKRFKIPAICCPSCKSETAPPIAVIIPPIKANDGMKKNANTNRISHGSSSP